MKRLWTGCLALCLCMCVGCANKTNVQKVPDYVHIMSDITQDNEPITPDNPIDPPIEELPEKPPALDGFETIGYLYDEATDFFGEYAWVQRDGKTMLLHCDGEEYAYTGEKVAFRQDKYITTDGETLRLCDVRKGVLLEGIYDRTEYDGNTALAIRGRRIYVFEDGKQTAQTAALELAIVRDGWLCDADGCIYDLYLQKQTVGDYDVVYPDTEGILTIRDAAGKYGYAYADRTVFVRPRFAFADRFVNGYAIAKLQNGKNLDYCILNRQGDVLTQTSMTVYPHSDGYFFCERKTDSGSQFVLYTQDMQAVALPDGLIPYNMRVYGDYVIDLSRNRVFSLQQNAYLPLDYISIQPIDCGFILAMPDRSYSLFSPDFSPLLSHYAHISFSHNRFKLSIDNSSFFFASLIS